MLFLSEILVWLEDFLFFLNFFKLFLKRLTQPVYHVYDIYLEEVMKIQVGVGWADQVRLVQSFYQTICFRIFSLIMRRSLPIHHCG